MKTLLSLMMQRLNTLEAPVIPFRDIQHYPAGDLSNLVRRGILRLAPDPEDIPHPERRSGSRVAVRRTEQGLCAVACEDDDFFPPFPLTEDDVRHYEVAIPKLVETIRQANGIVGSGSLPEGGMMAIGQKQIDGYGAVEIHFSFPNYDVRAFASQCLALRKAGGIKCVVVLVPLPLTLQSIERELLDARGVLPIPLLPVAECGHFVLDWEAAVVRAGAEPRPDGMHGRDIVLGGRVYKCELTKLQIDFLAIALVSEDVPIERVWHRGKGAIWKSKFVNERTNRNAISQFLTDLNGRLAKIDPPFPLLFSLLRGQQVIVRDTGSPK